MYHNPNEGATVVSNHSNTMRWVGDTGLENFLIPCPACEGRSLDLVGTFLLDNGVRAVMKCSSCRKFPINLSIEQSAGRMRLVTD